MKEQYQKEISRIHVPAELLEKTKSAMQEEQAKRDLPRTGKAISFKRVSMIAAAAVVLLVAAPMAFDIMSDSGREENEMQMYLTEQEEREPQAISLKKSWIEELVDTIKDFFD